MNIKIYIICAAIFILSFLGAWLLPVSEVFKGIVATPMVGALLGALWQIFRDYTAHERQKETQNKEHQYHLSISSHMANIAFDRHVEFCEKYISKLQEILSNLLFEYKAAEPLKLVYDLASIRRQYTPWITEEIANDVIPFEKALGKLGAHKELLQYEKTDEGRGKLLLEISNIFSDMVGSKKENSDKQIAINNIINKLQDLLGINELTRLRKKVLDEAIKN